MEVDQSLDVEDDTLLDRAFLYVATGLFALTIALATAQVLVRQLPFLSFIKIDWTVPVARFVLIVMTYIGAAVVTRNREHISIGILLDWVGKRYPRVRLGLSSVADVIVIGFLAIAVYGAALSTIGNWTTSVGSVRGISSGYIYLGIGIGLLGMLVYELMHLSAAIRAFLTGRVRAVVTDEKAVSDDG